METANAFDLEPFLALGAAGIAILLLGVVLIVATMAGALQLSIRWIGNRTPGFLSCLGWIIAIAFVNLFLVTSALSGFGPAGGLLATPLTWGVTIYMLASAGDCGLLRGFGIWIAQSFLSGIGSFFVVLVMAVPFAMLGVGVQSVEGNLQAEFDELDKMLDAEGVSEDGFNGPQPTPVGFPVGETNNPRISEEPSGGNENDAADPRRSSVPPTAAPASRSRKQKPRARPRRAADGSVLNPFFDQ